MKSQMQGRSMETSAGGKWLVKCWLPAQKDGETGLSCGCMWIGQVEQARYQKPNEA